MLQSASLMSFLEGTYLAQRRLRSTSTYTLRRHLQLYVQWLGHDPPISQVHADDVCQWLVAMQKQYAAWSVRGMRGSLLAVLSLGADLGLCQQPDRRRIRPVKRPRLIPTAWTAEEVRRLLAACLTLKHGAWLERMVRVAWDTGIRAEDLDGLDLRDFRPDGRGAIRQSKTSDPVLVCLRPATIACLQAAGRRYPLRRPVAKRQTYYWWRKLCDLAGVPYGASQRLRRSAATNVHCRRPGAATAFLGHSDPTLALRHYIDPRIAATYPHRSEEL